MSDQPLLQHPEVPARRGRDGSSARRPPWPTRPPALLALPPPRAAPRRREGGARTSDALGAPRKTSRPGRRLVARVDRANCRPRAPTDALPPPRRPPTGRLTPAGLFSPAPQRFHPTRHRPYYSTEAEFPLRPPSFTSTRPHARRPQTPRPLSGQVLLQKGRRVVARSFCRKGAGSWSPVRGSTLAGEVPPAGTYKVGFINKKEKKIHSTERDSESDL